MTYISEGTSTQKAKLQIKLSDQQQEATDAMDAYQRGKAEEANAKKKRGLWGAVVGAVIAGVVAATGGAGAFFAGPMWTYALGGAVGEQLGNVAYDQDWFEGDIGGSHHMAMEDTLEALKRLEEGTQFKDIREDLEKHTTLYDIEVDEFKTTGTEFFTEAGGDFLNYWTLLSGLKASGGKLSDIWTEAPELEKVI